MTRWLTILCVTALACGGCGKDEAAAPIATETTSGSEYADNGRCLSTKPGHEVTEYDTSGDQKADVRKLFEIVGEGKLARLVLVCREADLNADGTKDVVRFYTKEGRPEREEADRDFDGKIDDVTLFADGRIERQEIDTTGNGLIDTKIFYENGQPLRAERDVAGRSTADNWVADRWEYYQDGRTVRIGSDVDGDGKVDRWDRDEERLKKSALAEEGAADGSASQ